MVELGDGPLIHRMALDTGWPLIRGGMIIGRKVAPLTIGVVGMVKADFLPLRDVVATGALAGVVTLRRVFPGVAGFAVGVEVSVDADVIKVYGLPIGDVSVTVHTGAQVELLGGKELALPGYALAQPCEIPSVKVRASIPAWIIPLGSAR